MNKGDSFALNAYDKDSVFADRIITIEEEDREHRKGVYPAKTSFNGQQYRFVVKRTSGCDAVDIDRISRLNSPYTAWSIGAISENGTNYIVTERLDTSLYDYVYVKGETLCPEDKALIFISVLRAIRFLASENYFYSDVKPGNVVMNVNPNSRRVKSVKLCDFDAHYTSFEHTVKVGTRGYSAPDVFLTHAGRINLTNVVLYQIGPFLYELYTGRKFWDIGKDSSPWLTIGNYITRAPSLNEEQCREAEDGMRNAIRLLYSNCGDQREEFKEAEQELIRTLGDKNGKTIFGIVYDCMSAHTDEGLSVVARLDDVIRRYTDFLREADISVKLPYFRKGRLMRSVQNNPQYHVVVRSAGDRSDKERISWQTYQNFLLSDGQTAEVPLVATQRVRDYLADSASINGEGNPLRRDVVRRLLFLVALDGKVWYYCPADRKDPDRRFRLTELKRGEEYSVKCISRRTTINAKITLL